MGFIMDGLEAEAYDRTYSDSHLIARIIGYFRPKLRIMLAVAALIVLSSLLDTAFPILISVAADDAGKRLDQLLAAHLDVSRARVQQLTAARAISGKKLSQPAHALRFRPRG